MIRTGEVSGVVCLSSRGSKKRSIKLDSLNKERRKTDDPCSVLQWMPMMDVACVHVSHAGIQSQERRLCCCLNDSNDEKTD